MNRLNTAIALATECHKGQYRKDGQPYISHPLAVMNLLAHHDFPEDALIAAVLHDVCEDSHITNIEIYQRFGERVGLLLNGLSKNAKPKKDNILKVEYERDKATIKKVHNIKEYFDYRFLMYINRLYLGIIADPLILYIKISDQLHNLDTMGIFSREKQLRKIHEIERYFLPLYKKAHETVTPMYDYTYILFITKLEHAVSRHKLRLSTS